MPSTLRLMVVGLPLAALALAGCDREPALPPGVKLRQEQAATAKKAMAGREVAKDEKGVTAMADRVATLGLLNKRNNLTRELKLKPNEAVRIDNVIVKLAACERTAPWEDPPETGAFVQVFVEERATVRERLAWHKVFSGWLFKNAPSLVVVEHPVYDVWVKDCAMSFPGEEAGPKAAASASSAAKPAGKPSASPTATPSPTPSASSTATATTA